MTRPTPRQIKAAADRIRNEFPIPADAKGKALDALIRAQNGAIRSQLDEWGLTWSTHNELGCLVEGRSVWHTATFPDDSARVSGRWGDNPVEVELHLRMYSETADMRAGSIVVVEDADTAIHNRISDAAKRAAKQARAIERKQERTRAKYTDTTTSADVLAATVDDGMLF